MASLFQRKGVWYAIFTVRYRQKWIKIGRVSKTTAKEVLKKLEQDHEKKKFGIADEKLILFEDYAKEYLIFSNANKAPQSYLRDTKSIKNLSFFNTYYLPRITSHLIEQYKIKRLKEVAPRTLNIELRCLSHMLNKAVEWEYIKDTPFKGVKLISYEKKPPRFLTKEEVEKLLQNASDWLRPILIFMLNTGIREGERTRLKWEDIDFKAKRILIHSSKTKGYRVIPMNKEVEEVLKKKGDGYVFSNKDGTPVLKIKKSLANACKKAGLTGVTPHTLRHTFASHLVMNGVDLTTVQKLLGHTNISTTMIYSHLTEDHLTRGVERLTWQ